ncbi:carbohydrate ABC transporter permease [Streptomyces sp. SKN60]|uniref:carbohydrate ABC transporter permease n=1 Tax=Streptomyces sp. SKN60 TaxID=2855506 RepID=UPI0022452514|nr:carbohydrate ABC transporter permease [Streptomyces sp. SKN60]MCX2180045.1 carbohydrate ABC transporter permease [Streptomyces sp. SKN60]
MRGERGQGGERAGWGTYTLLLLFCAVSLFPLLWAGVAASRTTTRLAHTPPPLRFGRNLPEHLAVAWTDARLGAALFNTLLVAGLVAAGTVLVATLAGFAFARLRFRFRGALFALVVGTMLIPPQLGVVPLYLLVARLQWTDELRAVVLPGLVSAFGVFFMRQHLLRALPAELVEAARMDGAGPLRIVWHVVFPAARPAMAVLGTLTFVAAWNDFFWPVLVLTQTGSPTVQVALTGLGRGYIPDRSVVMAGALLGTVPLLLVFAVLGRLVVGGVMRGAVKG